MRWLLVAVLVAVPVIASAKPKVAIAAFDDDDGKVGQAVVDITGKHAKVVSGFKETKRAMASLGVSELTPKTIKKLRIKLGVDLVLHGSVQHDDGTKRHLSLVISGKGKTKATLELEFKNLKALYVELKAKLPDKLDEASGEGNDDDVEDDDAPKVAKHDDPPPKKHDDDAPPPKHDDPPPKRHDDEDRPKKHDDDAPRHVAHRDDDARVTRSSDDDGESHHHHKHRHAERNPSTQAAVWADVGPEVARRTLTYDGGGVNMPPQVGTAGFAGAIEGEIYPLSFDSLDSAGAGLGLFGNYSKTMGLSIAVPGTTSSAAIDDGYYSVGARYRLRIGQSSLAVGVAYWRRKYIANRSGASSGLDMPDVDYSAVAPGAIVRFPITPSIAGFAAVDVPLMLSTGPISTAADYGRGQVIAFDVDAGVQITVAPHYALQLAALFDQVGFKFSGGMNTVAAARGVTGATDRSIGVTAAIGLHY
ncbi:MAG TPA: hypothetical protein VLX92_06170 [Kofleriaceae bacterium]|nr:hypothetical protein [Kofleriaceae bacterium]